MYVLISSNGLCRCRPPDVFRRTVGPCAIDVFSLSVFSRSVLSRSVFSRYVRTPALQSATSYAAARPVVSGLCFSLRIWAFCSVSVYVRNSTTALPQLYLDGIRVTIDSSKYLKGSIV